MTGPIRPPEPRGSHEGHDGESFSQAVDRVSDGLEDPFDKHTKSRGRYGWKDLLFGHALTNLFVTFSRENPRAAGHWWLYTCIAALGLAIGLVVAIVL